MPSHRLPRPVFRVRVSLLLIAVLSLATTAALIATESTAATATSPVRAAFYYPWYPETEHWASHYTPTLGHYDSSDPAVLDAHIAAAQYAGLDAFIASWWGQGSLTDGRLPLLLHAAQARGFSIAPYYEPEGLGTRPSAAALASDLSYLYALANASPAWLRVAGKPVLFVYNAGANTCSETTRWAAANAGRFYVDLKVFAGYTGCASQPDSWHQYGPATGYDQQGAYSASVSPGFWKFNESTPRLARNLTRFQSDLARQAASGARWQLLTTFNEWGEGTAVESATSWASASHEGVYLDAMRSAYAPAGAALSSSSGSTPVATPATATLTADTVAASDQPGVNMGAAPYIGTDGSPLREGYFQFHVSVAAGTTVTSARFSCWAGSTNPVGFTVHPATGAWTESGLTWANRPAPGVSLGSTGAVTAGAGTPPVDVRSAIRGSGTYTFVTETASPTRWSCLSKENTGGHPATLTITVST